MPLSLTICQSPNAKRKDNILYCTFSRSPITTGLMGRLLTVHCSTESGELGIVRNGLRESSMAG